MGIMTKPGKGKRSGDVGAPDKAKRDARAAQFSDVANARVAQVQRQSQNGFKGQELNDHGLPLGGSDIIQSSDANEPGAKFRPQKSSAAKMEEGSKGIKLKKKA